MERNQRKQFYHCKGIERSELMEALLTYIYYSFKIFPRFRLAKSTLIIYHNQLLMMEEFCDQSTDDVKSTAPLLVNASLTEKT